MGKKTRVRYPLEFKREAVKLLESGMTLAQAARQLEIAEQTLHSWVKAQREGGLRATPTAGAGAPSAEQLELARLKKRLAQVEMERDILRKATAYFAKESL